MRNFISFFGFAKLMKRLNKSLKSIVAAGCFAGIILGFPPQSGANPSIETQERYAETIREKYTNILLKFQEGLEDNFLNLGEQQEIDREYWKISDLENLFCPDIDPIEGSDLYKQVARYSDLVDKNLNGYDIGQPELEKELHAKGLLDVKVEGTTSDKESTTFGFTALAAVVGYLISYSRRKSKV